MVHAGKIPFDEECDDESIDFGVAYFSDEEKWVIYDFIGSIPLCAHDIPSIVGL